MSTSQHPAASKESIDVMNIEEKLREALATLPVERTLDFNVAKVHQQLLDSFHTYESPQTNFVSDRDMPNVIYSLGFVPTLHEMNQLVLAMRSHPQSRAMDHEEIDAEHHLIHLASFADVIIPKLAHREYPSASESDLLKYLKKLDQTNKNHLHKKLFIQTLSSMEDALDTNESEQLAMFFNENDALAIENRPDFFDYKRYVKHLLPERHRIYLNLLTKESK